MYKFIITIKLKPGSLETIREAARPCQAATRAEPGCLSYDFYVSIDDPDAMTFVECFESKEAHEWHGQQPYVQDFLNIFRPLSLETKFETVNAAA
jgi:quinol monooxygenase YgiN